ncbi:MAG: hypothetical protein LBQ32_04135 [Burkholderiaceae bacterium]|jgi:hypothetical protein|nr:hypothetical protein [Burkholderiaceae bacterium]
MRLQLVPARTGLRWVREGVRTFWRMPLAFGGLFLMFVTGAGAVALIPLIGAPLVLAMVPAATLGLMVATRQVAENGGIPLPAMLVVAFRQSPRQTRAMLILGALYVGALLGIAAISAWMDDGQMAKLIAKHGDSFSPELMADPEIQPAARAFLRQILVSSLLYTPVSVLLWHAPALVHWHGMPVGKSLFFSAVAVLRNTSAYLAYGIGWVAVASIGWTGLLVVAGMIGNPGIAIVGMPLLAILVAAMFNTSLWFTFRDSFAADTPPAQAPPPDTQR